MKMNKKSHLDKPHRQIGAAAAFIEEQLASGRVAFSLNKIIEKTGLSVIAAKNQLRRLLRQGSWGFSEAAIFC
jgi:hypothetical protein